MNILLTSVGRRTYLVKYFKKVLGDSGKVHVSNSSATTPAFTAADKAVVTPLINEKEYIPFLMSYCQENKIDAIIPLFDIDLPVLAENREDFCKLGIQVVVSAKSVIDICNDKAKTYQFLTDNEFHAPRTCTSLEEALSALKNGGIAYPVIIKPRWGMGSIGVFEADNEAELHVLFDKTLKSIRESYLNFESQGKPEEAVIIQEKLDSQEYGLDIINDLNANYKNTIVKLKHAMRAGETDCAETVNHLELKKLGEVISRKLGHIGNLDVDVFMVDGFPYVLEMNARFGGGYPFSHAAGVNLPEAIINWVQGKEAPGSLFRERFGILSHKDIEIVEIDPGKPIVIQQIEDASEILNLLHEFNTVFSPPITSKVDSLESYAKKLSDNAFVYVAKSSKILGFISFYANDLVSRTAYISFIGVHLEARKKRIGTKLLDMCCEKSKEQKMEYLKLEVQKENLNALSFYKKYGFIYLEEAKEKSIHMIKKI